LILVGGLLGSPGFAWADRGALTLEGGGHVAFTDVGVPYGTGANVVGTSGGGSAGLRYAITNRLELAVGGFWDPAVSYLHQPVALATANGAFSGAMPSRVGGFGAHGGVRYALYGLVWRFKVGCDLGWAHTYYEQPDLVDVSDPATPVSYGLKLSNVGLDRLLVAPTVGVEWQASDHFSVSLMPRLQALFGSQAGYSVVLPLTIGWSWYFL